VSINTVETHLSASARSSATAAVVAELQSRHATEVRSYVRELWDGNDARAAKSLAAFWRGWVPPPGVADEIPREYVFAGARRHVVAEQRGAGISVTETDTDDRAAEEASDPSTRIAARFRRLTAKQQEMVRLHLHHRFDIDEMAEITELPAASAAQLLHTGVSRLNGVDHEETHLVQLALDGASGEQLATESPDVRGRIAALRVTIEVARQVLARGPEAFVATRKRSRRRPTLIIAIAVLVGVAAAGFFWLRSRTATVENTPHRANATGTSRVAIGRVGGNEAPPPTNLSRADGAKFSSSSTNRPRHNPRDSTSRTSDAASKREDKTAAPATAKLPPAPIDAPAHDSADTANAPADTPAPEHGIETGAVNQAEPLAHPRGASDARKIHAPPATRRGEADSPPSARPSSEEHSDTANAPTPAPAAAESPVGTQPSSPQIPPPRSQTRQSSLASPAPAPSKNSDPHLRADRVDTAPIAALRRALGATRWPQRDEVNVAALLDAVPPSAQSSSRNAPAFTAQIESSQSPWNADRQLVRVALRAREHVATHRARATVILLLDVSGSMDAPNRLPLVQTAVAGLLRRLQPDDRVGVVTYAGESRVLLPPAALSDERAVRAAIDALEAQGRTNGGAGLREAFRLAASDRVTGGEHVVILCTDGDFNMGETSEAELGALIDQHRDTGVRLAIFGFGRPDRIDARLEALAARAHGGSGYVNTRAEAELALVSQLDALFAPVAEKLEATVEFDASRVARFRVLGESEMQPVRAGAEVTFASREHVLPGEVLSIVFEIEPVSDERPSDSSHVRVRAVGFAAVESREKTPYYEVWPDRIARAAFAATSVDFRFAAATAAFGEALQAGSERGGPQLDEIERWASGAVGEDAGGYRAELLAMIEQARRAAIAR
jgi:Ca-activated chloride channel homolog